MIDGKRDSGPASPFFTRCGRYSRKSHQLTERDPVERLTRYKLNVRLEIQKEEFTGIVNADGTYDEHSGYWNSQTHERLSISEDLNLGSMNFIGVMGVLGELHNSIGKVKDTNDSAVSSPLPRSATH